MSEDNDYEKRYFWGLVEKNEIKPLNKKQFRENLNKFIETKKIILKRKNNNGNIKTNT